MTPLTQKESREIQMSMLKEIDSFCRTNGITYYLAFGTLLGAVRHQGFIPWDDDIDIMMPRKDYERFEQAFSSVKNYRFLTKNNTENFPYPFGKVIDTRTVKKEPLRTRYQVIGLDIDVFPIDNYPNESEEAKRWCQKISSTQKTLYKTFVPYSKGRTIFRTIVKNTITAFFHLIDDLGICSVKRLVSKIDAVSQQYNSLETKYCGIAVISTYGERKRNRKEIYASSVDVPFEGSLFSAPIGYDEYLTDTYGDYMQLPPIEKRKTHHLNMVYWK